MKEKKSKNQLRRERLRAKARAKSQENQIQKKEPKKLEPVVIPGVNDSQLKEKPLEVKKLEKLFESELDQYAKDENFKRVINRFHMDDNASELQEEKGDVIYSDEEKPEENVEVTQNGHEPQEMTTLSKRKLRRINRIPLLTLKSEARKPELVEWYDADAPDPRLLVYIKCLKNIVPVPDHWQAKRDYLSAKRGFEKPPFALPQFIRDTGIMDLRDPIAPDLSTLKQKSREKVQPKMNRMDLDYNKLHDAFFKYQQKPRLYGYGSMYYEGKEADKLADSNMRLRPGRLSVRLRKALGIANGADAPWVSRMKRFGPPPSYPGLFIQGLDTRVGGSRLEVDSDLLAPVEKAPWGELQEGEEEEEEEDEEEEDEEDDEVGEEDDDIKYSRDLEDEQAVPVESVNVSEARPKIRGTIGVDTEASNKPLYEVLENVDGRYRVGSGQKREVEPEESEDSLAIKRAKYENEREENTFKF